MTPALKQTFHCHQPHRHALQRQEEAVTIETVLIGVTSSFGPQRSNSSVALTMAPGRSLTSAFILCNILGLAAASTDSSVSCYRIEPWTVAGVIGADVVLTLIIVAITYRCASTRQKAIKSADNIYMNTRANVKKNNKQPPKWKNSAEEGVKRSRM
eukprot:XP_011604070.1 PREDICTED: uncharacterized protein LOC105416712 isoform X1 [Takifugu rubripes]